MTARLAVPAIALLLAACHQPQPTTLATRQPTRTPADPTAGVADAVHNATTTTTPPPTTTTRPRASRGRTTTTSTAPAVVVPRGDIERAICAAFGDQCAKAIAVARCESGLRPGAVNGNHRGLFQVSIYWHAARIQRLGYSLEEMTNVAPNIAVARNIQLEQGWRPWTCA